MVWLIDKFHCVRLPRTPLRDLISRPLAVLVTASLSAASRIPVNAILRPPTTARSRFIRTNERIENVRPSANRISKVSRTRMAKGTLFFNRKSIQTPLMNS